MTTMTTPNPTEREIAREKQMTNPWRDLATDPPQDDDCEVVLFPSISDVGIMYVTSNPVYARVNGVKHGYTHWMLIPRHKDHNLAKARCEALED